ncbi:MAG: hypothetical protein ACTHMM_26840 [Agriterribacter sp.]
MATLQQDIKTQSDWIIKAFAADKLKLDYTIKSFMEIDRFFYKHAENGQAIKGGRLANNLGATIFSIGAYIGETITKNVKGAIWDTDDNDAEGEINASVKMPDGTIIFPMQRVMKRFKNGAEDAVYVYGHQITKDYTNEAFDQSFWNIASEENGQAKKPWWKIW